MLDATTTLTGNNTTELMVNTTTPTGNTTADLMLDSVSGHEAPEASRPRISLPSTRHACSSCVVFLHSVQGHRELTKQPWQQVNSIVLEQTPETDILASVHNVKRRIEGLSPLPPSSLQVKPEDKWNFQDTGAGQRLRQIRHRSGGQGSSGESSSEEESERQASPFQCLFCIADFPADDSGLAANLEHMQTSHWMSVPHPETVTDMHSFVSYLATEVRIWHECLFCGATRPSTTSVQCHMRDKGHCLLNLEREPGLLDFWDQPGWMDADYAAIAEQARLQLTVPNHVANTTETAPTQEADTTRTSVVTVLERQSHSPEMPPSGVLPPIAGFQSLVRGQQPARSDEMGLIGLSVAVAEKKAQRSEAVASRAREWILNSGANFQKYDQVDGKRKHGKQNHKLQPR